MKLHDKQREIVVSPARFKLIRAGRKGGKTAEEVETIVFKATASASKLGLTKITFPTGRKVLYKAPTQVQARQIIWEALKSRLNGVGKANEQTLEMRVPNEDGETSVIKIGGWENRENDRGLADVIHITFDEIDTLKGFFISWQEIYRPMFLDTGGTANFIGTPKKENPNLKRLEKEWGNRPDVALFKFTSLDNPYLSQVELEALKTEYEGNMQAYKQEILAEYVEDSGALFKYTALIDMFSNTITKGNEKYLIVDVADDGSDKTIFNFFQGLESYRIEKFERLNTEMIITQIRDYASQDKIPYSQIAVDAIGVGAGVASSSYLDGVVAYKSSFAPFKIDRDEVKLPNVHYLANAPRYAEYANLRSQCVFTLADLVNNHKFAVRTEDVRVKEHIIEELSHYQDISKGDGKRLATHKEDVKALIGRSPDISDTLIMRIFFHLKERLQPMTSEQANDLSRKIKERFDMNENRQVINSTK